MRKIFSVGMMLFAVVACFCALPQSSALAANITVDVRVEGPEKNIINAPKYAYVDSSHSKTVLVKDVLVKVLQDNKLTYDVYEKYCYFTRIGSYSEEKINSTYIGWSYAINGIPVSNTNKNITVTNGDKIVLFYGDMRVAVPSYKAKLNDNGTITLVLLYTGNNANWDYVTNAPLVNVTVFWDGTSYKTDNNGTIIIPSQYSSGGNHTVQIQRYTSNITLANGEFCANVVRLSPDNVLKITNFSDLGGYEWSKVYIYNLVKTGIINGLNDQTYNPSGYLTRAQFVKMLFQLKGANIYDYQGYSMFMDVPVGSWFLPYVNWAKINGVTDGKDADTFDPDGNITRQDFVTMLQRFSDTEGIKLLPTVNTPVFQDEIAINDYAKIAVSTLSATGIINGYSEVGGMVTFKPLNNTNRAEAAKMLSLFRDIYEKGKK